jgi:mRNA interferase MazF
MPSFQWAVMTAYLDPIRGSEQRGLRPVLIVSNEEFNQAVPNVTVLPLTSTRRQLYPSEVMLPNGRAGQPFDSIILAHQIRTISKERLVSTYGYLEDLDVRLALRDAIREHLDL